jgi:hypothetical protein
MKNKSLNFACRAVVAMAVCLSWPSFQAMGAGDVAGKTEDKGGIVASVKKLLLSHKPGSNETGGRGLLTTQGPSGTYVNPTSATLPERDFTFQYCTVSPNNSDTPVKPHGFMVGYGVRDDLEVGGVVSYASISPGEDEYGFGPLVRLRLRKQDGNIP